MNNFSVLMSVYTKENPIFLRDCLDSIVNQTIKPTEIVVVKDGKLNQELENILTNFNEKYDFLKIYGYEKNMGLGFALNYGLNKCSNEIVFRCDSDDINNLNRFKLQLECIICRNCAIVGSNIEEFNSIPGDLKRYRNLPKSNHEISVFKHSRNPFNHMTVVFRKSIILNSGGYLDMPGYEDYYLWLRVLKTNEGFNIQSPLVYARVGNDMIGRRQGYDFMKYELKFQKQIFRDGLISSISFCKNIITRVFPRLFPKFFLSLIYKIFLRK